MIHKLLKTISLIFFSLLLCFLSYKLCYFIAEKYFFDKFFYQKSVTHGYWPLAKFPYVYHIDFGDRAKDIYDLQTNYPNELLTNDENIFKIALYGDSYVWGQGIKNEQRFAKILEAKLNKIRPTRIFSLAETGDNIFDHYQKYKATPAVFGRIDLNIFGLNFNDLVFSSKYYNRYQTQEYLDSVSYFDCTGTKITDDSLEDYKISASMDKNNANYCVYKKIVSFLPKDKTIYFDLGGAVYMSNYPDQLKFINLISQDLPIFRPYSREILSSPHPNKYNVSQTDAHPSALANQLYADLLYQEITTNPKWGFIKNE